MPESAQLIAEIFPVLHHIHVSPTHLPANEKAPQSAPTSGTQVPPGHDQPLGQVPHWPPLPHSSGPHSFLVPSEFKHFGTHIGLATQVFVPLPAS